MNNKCCNVFDNAYYFIITLPKFFEIGNDVLINILRNKVDDVFS